MSKRVLISFLGSHDLKPHHNGPIEQMSQYIKPDFSYIFISKEYMASFTEELKDFYRSTVKEGVEFVETEIENPSDFNEISNKITDKLEEINKIVVENKYEAYLNLTSGTPAMISVLALSAIMGLLNRTVGLYASNPEKGKGVKTNTLDFYRDSVSYKTVLSLINSMDYVGLSAYLKNNFKRLQGDTEFIYAVEFCKNRVMCNFEEAKKYYQKSQLLQKNDIVYEEPKDLFEKSVECYMSAKVAERNNDIFQSTLKLAIARENLLSYLVYGNEKSLVPDIIEFKSKYENKKGNKENKLLPFLKQGSLDEELEEHLSKKLGTLDYSREVTAYTTKLIFEYFVQNSEEEETKEILKNINNELSKLESLVGARNNIAHEIKSPKNDSQWNQSVEKIISDIAEYFNYKQPVFDEYTKLNKILIDRLKQTVLY